MTPPTKPTPPTEPPTRARQSGAPGTPDAPAPPADSRSGFGILLMVASAILLLAFGTAMARLFLPDEDEAAKVARRLEGGASRLDAAAPALAPAASYEPEMKLLQPAAPRPLPLPAP